jgi:hypothetical protein
MANKILQSNGYRDSIEKGIAAVSYFNRGVSFGHGTMEENIESLKEKLLDADAVVIGAGAGLSTAAGLFTVVQDLQNTFLILGKAMDIRICMQVDFIHILRRKYSGLIGQDTYILTGTWMPQRILIKSLTDW